MTAPIGTRGCGGKVPYANRSDALEARRAFRARRGEAKDLGAYHCAHCGAFHLGRLSGATGRERHLRFDKGAKLRRYLDLERGKL